MTASTPDLAALVCRAGPVPLGTQDDDASAVGGGLLATLAATAVLLTTEWTARLALAQTVPELPPDQLESLVLSRRGDLVLAERVRAGERHRTLLHVDDLGALLTESFLGAGRPDELVEDRVLDQDELAAGRWPSDVLALLPYAVRVLQAACARAGETTRAERPVVTCLLGEQGVLLLDARPAERRLTSRHRDGLGAGQLLAELLLDEPHSQQPPR